MFVSDLRHFLDMPPDAPGPALRMANQLALIVRAATAGDPGTVWRTAVTCVRRPGRRPCPGHIAVFRIQVPPSIEWRCTSCGDDGVIRGWEGSGFDLRHRGEDPAATESVRAVIPPEVAATLQTLLLLDTAAERLLFRATVSEAGVMLAGDEEAFEELLDGVAAEANHEEDRRRKKRLDGAYEAIDDALRHARQR